MFKVKVTLEFDGNVEVLKLEASDLTHEGIAQAITNHDASLGVIEGPCSWTEVFKRMDKGGDRDMVLVEMGVGFDISVTWELED